MRGKLRKEHALFLLGLASLRLSLAFHLPTFRVTQMHKEPYSLGLQPYKETKEQTTKHKQRNATKFFQNEFPRFLEEQDVTARDSTAATGNSSSLTRLSNLNETNNVNKNTTAQAVNSESANKSSLPKNYEWPDPNRVLSSLNLQRKAEIMTKKEDNGVLDEFLTFVNGSNRSTAAIKDQDFLTKAASVSDLLPFEGRDNRRLDMLTDSVPSNSFNRSAADALLLFLPAEEGDIDKAFDAASEERVVGDPQEKAPSIVPKQVQRQMNDKKSEEYVTVKDLQSMLTEILEQQKMQYQQEQNRSPETAAAPKKSSRGMIEQSTKTSSSSSTSGVAFPQPSKLDSNALKKGNSVAGLLLGLMLGMSILPSLWLFGSIVGAVYGYNITPLDEQNVVGRLISQLGRRIARASLSVYDYANTIFFMYKTGQLSYEYYQRYATLDQKFAIQNKIDAFNARFAEGKIKFDKWEKENEVGRRVLAGVRTLWLVEEQSRKKNSRILRRGSRYRVVQLFYDAAFFLGRAVGNIWKTLTGKGGSELKEFVRGIQKWNDAEEESIGARLGAALWASAAVSLVGTLFSLSPFFLTFMALAGGFVWPTWPSEVADAFAEFWIDRRRRGQEATEGDDSLINASPRLFPFFSKEEPSGRNKLDKSRYHFYKTTDGKKKYYRAGVPGPFWNLTRRAVKKKRWGFLASEDEI